MLKILLTRRKHFEAHSADLASLKTPSLPQIPLLASEGTQWFSVHASNLALSAHTRRLNCTNTLDHPEQERSCNHFRASCTVRGCKY
jgi:hypothetical protein